MAALGQRQNGHEADYAELVHDTLTELDRRARLVIRPDLRVLWSSSNAERMLTRPSPVRLVDGELRFPDSNRSDGAKAFLEQVGSTPSCHLLRGSDSGNWAVLWAWRLPLRHHAIAVVCNLSIPCCGVAESGLADELGLTPSETSVLEHFARLHAPKDIAELLDISVDTVRSHLKQIYAKADVQSATQLLSLTGGFCAH